MEVIMAIANEHPRMQFSQPNAHPASNENSCVPAGLAILALNDSGDIQTCCLTGERLFGYRQAELEGRHVSTLLPGLKDVELVLEDRINARLAFLCHCAIPFQARRRDGTVFPGELFINRLASQNVVVLVRGIDTPHRNAACLSE
jgi:PAS domain S-box-containing protein